MREVGALARAYTVTSKGGGGGGTGDKWRRGEGEGEGVEARAKGGGGRSADDMGGRESERGAVRWQRGGGPTGNGQVRRQPDEVEPEAPTVNDKRAAGTGGQWGGEAHRRRQAEAGTGGHRQDTP